MLASQVMMRVLLVTDLRDFNYQKIALVYSKRDQTTNLYGLYIKKLSSRYLIWIYLETDHKNLFINNFSENVSNFMQPRFK